MSEPAPPDNIGWLVEALGVETTLLLIETFGGTQLWVPSGLDGDHQKTRAKFEDIFGKPATQALIRHFGGWRLEVPRCEGWRTRLYRARGMSDTQIALKVGCTRRTVWRRLRDDRSNAAALKQLHLEI